MSKTGPYAIALAVAGGRTRVAAFPSAMSLFLLSLLALTVAAAAVTARAVAQARDGSEGPRGFTGAGRSTRDPFSHGARSPRRRHYGSRRVAGAC